MLRSGAVFYTGQQAFSGEQPLYILGLNPGGNPESQANETIGRHLQNLWQRSAPWSEYADERWAGKEPGAHQMQPRVLHMLAKLNLDPHKVPASNVIFARSRNEVALKEEKEQLLTLCWPVHQAVIESLQVRVVACFGSTAGSWVCDKLGANHLIDEFQELNHRGWKSKLYRSTKSGIAVATLTHPSIADWRNPKADPTKLIEKALKL